MSMNVLNPFHVPATAFQYLLAESTKKAQVKKAQLRPLFYLTRAFLDNMACILYSEPTQLPDWQTSD